MDEVQLGKLLEAVRDVRATARLEQELPTALATRRSEDRSGGQEARICDDWMTQDELASWLKVSRTTVWRLIPQGRIPVYRVGRATRIRRDEVERRLMEGGDGELG